MKKLNEIDFIETALLKFTEMTIKQTSYFGMDYTLKNSQLKLQLNDIIIDEKSKIYDSIGRYYFKKYYDTYIPQATLAGVYCFFNKKKIGLYVGKSDVEYGLGRRIWAHIGKRENNKFPYLEFKEAEYVIVIPFKFAPYLASAYEGYLLENYSFDYNKQKNYS